MSAWQKHWKKAFSALGKSIISTTQERDFRMDAPRCIRNIEDLLFGGIRGVVSPQRQTDGGAGVRSRKLMADKGHISFWRLPSFAGGVCQGRLESVSRPNGHPYRLTYFSGPRRPAPDVEFSRGKAQLCFTALILILIPHISYRGTVIGPDHTGSLGGARPHGRTLRTRLS